MASRVVLHVGLMKSGTSYLQQRLDLNRALLRDRGLLFPGEAWKDQAMAVAHLVGRQRAGPRHEEKWADLLAEGTAYPGTVLVSMEFLGPARPEHVTAAVAAWGSTPVEAVVTVRDLGRGVPAMWQERLQNGGSLGWGEYVAALAGPGRPSRAFWRQQGAGRIVDAWSRVAPVSVVTVPPADARPGLLWERFGTAIGADLSGCADLPAANTSLDAASAGLLRALNLALDGEGLSSGDYDTLVKFGVAKRRLADRSGPGIGFEPPDWLLERSAQLVARLAGSGARVVGDLADLEPVAVSGADPDNIDADPAEVAALRQEVLDGARQRRL